MLLLPVLLLLLLGQRVSVLLLLCPVGHIGVCITVCFASIAVKVLILIRPGGPSPPPPSCPPPPSAPQRSTSDESRAAVHVNAICILTSTVDVVFSK